MKWLLLFLGTVAGTDHLISFNANCTATFNLLAGTPAQGALAADHVPGQFIRSLQRVMQARVAAVPGCSGFGVLDTQWPPTSLYSQLFGMDVINLIRFLDATDQTIANANFGNCPQDHFNFNWKRLRAEWPGILMPSTCKASNFYANDCRFTFQVLQNLNATVWIADKCGDPKEAGYRLPQIEVRCTGSLCASFAKPCTMDSECGAGLTCSQTDLELNNGTQGLEDIGLYNSTNDAASCPTDAQGFTFAEQFFSKVINEVAGLLGFTVPATQKWKKLSICGGNEIHTKYVPSEAPTPVPLFVCQNGTQKPQSALCNGQNDCGSYEDEYNCGCGSGFFVGSNGRCCHLCDTDDDCKGWGPGAGGQYCSLPNNGNNGPQICTTDQATGALDCSQYIGPTTGATGTVNYPTLQSVPNPSGGNVVGWADCNGNVQIGNPSAIGVANFLTPYHNMAARAEKVIKDTQACRVGSDMSDDFLRRHFFPWGITWIGSIFLDDLWSTPKFNGQTPGAKLDRVARWYKSSGAENCTTYCPQNCTFGCVCSSSCTYIVPPPFANLQNAWSTCNLASLTGSKHACQINAAIQNWFLPPGFPASWAVEKATLALTLESSCNGDVLPQAYLTCNGACSSGNTPQPTDSGCCLMSRPLIVLTSGASCPAGYTTTGIESSVTDDLLFNRSVYNATTKDTVLINFLQLLAAHAVDFGNFPAFVPPTVGGTQSICVIDGTSFGDNTDSWAGDVYTESCPVPYNAPGNGNKGCPQILAGGPAQPCGVNGQAACVDPPVGTNCPASGCPNSPTPGPGGCLPGTVCSGGFWVAPALFTLLLPMII